jgi:hypothetical protein
MQHVQPTNPLLLHPVGTARAHQEVRTIRLWVVALVVALALTAMAPSLVVHRLLGSRPAPSGPAACRSAAAADGLTSYRSRAAAIEAMADGEADCR